MNPLMNITSDYAHSAMNNLIIHKKGNVNELLSYRENVPVLIAYINQLEYSLHDAWSWVEAFNKQEMNNKKWSDLEDNLLIDCVCDGRSIVDLSALLGRTVGAIKTRLSHLVGVKRISQSIAGKFIGEIDGQQTEAKLVGTVYRE